MNKYIFTMKKANYSIFSHKLCQNILKIDMLIHVFKRSCPYLKPNCICKIESTAHKSMTKWAWLALVAFALSVTFTWSSVTFTRPLVFLCDPRSFLRDHQSFLWPFVIFFHDPQSFCVVLSHFRVMLNHFHVIMFIGNFHTYCLSVGLLKFHTYCLSVGLELV